MTLFTTRRWGHQTAGSAVVSNDGHILSVASTLRIAAYSAVVGCLRGPPPFAPLSEPEGPAVDRHGQSRRGHGPSIVFASLTLRDLSLHHKRHGNNLFGALCLRNLDVLGGRRSRNPLHQTAKVATLSEQNLGVLGRLVHRGSTTVECKFKPLTSQT